MGGQKGTAAASRSLRDARTRFSAVVEAAQHGRPQLITRRGAPAAVVIAVDDYARLRSMESQARPSFADCLLAMPRDDQSFGQTEAGPRVTEP
jgi:antitoxin Phd